MAGVDMRQEITERPGAANLKYANLKYANLKYANLKYANLKYASLKYASLKYIEGEFPPAPPTQGNRMNNILMTISLFAPPLRG